MKKVIFPVLLLSVFYTSSLAYAQPNGYYGALLYSIPRVTSVPPIYSGQPAQVTTAYLWLDEAMRLSSEATIESYINSFKTWNDTPKTIVSNIYQMIDDNPVSFYIWSGKAIHPNPYKGDPGQARQAVENWVMHIGDKGQTSSLLGPDIIADVMVNDTFCTTDPTAYIAKDGVFVNSTILDEIKGKKVPLCVGEDMRSKRKGNGITTLSTATTAWPTYAVPADSGACLQFEYSPEWSPISGDDEGKRHLIDSLGGWWVKPGHEYIVFLSFMGIDADSVNGYFTVVPGSAVQGTMGGMYPVIDGIVQDPNDDFGIGASAGLTVTAWKAALRAKINSIIHP
jgi:hypothetical protein